MRCQVHSCVSTEGMDPDAVTTGSSWGQRREAGRWITHDASYLGYFLVSLEIHLDNRLPSFGDDGRRAAMNFD
ncbi:hypothetical protein GCM10022226_79210 [Sphaerisporangium flaviroseum]|uniref:Uncharacterized protein n=1 Tax=Sphaerisporangium flaviroseum TaxID=509199 RepID=A0ABP7JGQ9_9ACTN